MVLDIVSSALDEQPRRLAASSLWAAGKRSQWPSYRHVAVHRSRDACLPSFRVSQDG
jgi:hypothetical protein